jgi:hypothetical protein
MNAAEIAVTLVDARCEGRLWRCRCRLHGGRFVLIRDGDGGPVLAISCGSRDRLDVLAELRRRGTLDRRPDHEWRVASTPRFVDALRSARELDVWPEQYLNSAVGDTSEAEVA